MHFDYIFIDAWKPDYYKFLNLLRTRVKPGGAITAHNVISAGRQMQDFLNAIKNDSGFETEIINSSRSGVSVSIVKVTNKYLKWTKVEKRRSFNFSHFGHL